MSITELFHLIKADKRRVKCRYFLKLFFPHPDSYFFWYRLHSFFQGKNIVLRILGVPIAMIHYVNSILLGIQILKGAKVGGGIAIKHYSCIVVSKDSIIGNNCTLHQGVTLGRVFGGEKAGCPTLGNNVICFPGSKIIGKITVGDNVIIGANAVVTNDVPSNCVVVGAPARIVSRDSKSVINEEHFWYFGWKKD